MWFKHFQIFKLAKRLPRTADEIDAKLRALEFTSCLPTLPSSFGFIPPIEEDAEGAKLARGLNHCISICFQIEEKILPTNVVTQALKEKIKTIEQNENRRIRQKEKATFKDELIFSLLPRAFTKLTKIYAYIDTKNKWVVVNSISPNKTEMFLNAFKRVFGEVIAAFDIVKPSSILTEWLLKSNYPKTFSIEKNCVLQDQNQETRIIRCKQQNLFEKSIQSLAKDGCQVIEIALCWHDRLNFTLSNDFSVRSLSLANDDIKEFKDVSESEVERFTADFYLMTESYNSLISDLLSIFCKDESLALTGS